MGQYSSNSLPADSFCVYGDLVHSTRDRCIDAYWSARRFLEHHWFSIYFSGRFACGGDAGWRWYSSIRCRIIKRHSHGVFDKAICANDYSNN